MFKPMLAGKCTDITKLNYPVLVSPKLDGIRATIQNGVVLSRSLKPIPNRYCQELFKNLPVGLDGELIVGSPTDKDVYRTSVSGVMREDGEPDVKFYAFDIFNRLPFKKRLDQIGRDLKGDHDVSVVTHIMVTTPDELTRQEEFWLEQGFEGLMVRCPDAPYKQGRSTEKEGWLLKVKRFCDAEATIVGFYEEMENQNDAKKNALGRTERSTCKDGMVGKGTLGGFNVRGLEGSDYADVEFSIGGGFTADERLTAWKDRKLLIGAIVKYRYFPTGSKERPRFPVFQGFRDKRDM
jgi:DNA ligase-1